MPFCHAFLTVLLGLIISLNSQAGSQIEEPLSRSVRAMMQRSISDKAPAKLVLGLIQVESGFNKYAVSTAGAPGFMQIMPFWPRAIGASDHNLFLLRTNLRYGCTILRHYLDRENGDLFRALGRYNGSLGQSAYPNLVLATWRKHWDYPSKNGDFPAKFPATHL
jgi:soluble lytic murein transglycosylase-like protein